MSAPTLENVKTYLGDTSHDDGAILSALSAESAAQAKRCRIPDLTPINVPVTGEWSGDPGITFEDSPGGWTRVSGNDVEGFGLSFAYIFDTTGVEFSPYEILTMSVDYSRLSEGPVDGPSGVLDAAIGAEGTYVQQIVASADIDGQWGFYNPAQLGFYSDGVTTVFDYGFKNPRMTRQVGYPADLLEALYRRVAHNLALRGLPLGLQASISEAAVSTNFVGGTDAEVARLEAPYRRMVVG